MKKIKLRICGRRTFVYDAVHHALKRMKKIPGRKAIVLFSDGFSGERDATAKSTLREAEEQEALIYSVQFGPILLRPVFPGSTEFQQDDRKRQRIHGWYRSKNRRKALSCRRYNRP